MNQGVLYRYAPESESEEPQLVAPEHERTLIIQEHHDALSTVHYETERNIQLNSHSILVDKNEKIHLFIHKYVSNPAEIALIAIDMNNQKLSGLLQTLVQSKKFEVISIDHFNPLPESKDDDSQVPAGVVPLALKNFHHTSSVSPTRSLRKRGHPLAKTGKTVRSAGFAMKRFRPPDHECGPCSRYWYGRDGPVDRTQNSLGSVNAIFRKLGMAPISSANSS
ncbi:reverse transcriptase [Caerostris extrusa]|uniref:Reverse transcriptase n=1 Tax=Caerostris extrusa TaxID=172846 RepID=A0AAV4Y2Z2_CAEEX|nr:reverse transcriptase [Caerostris extrusa]